MILIDTSAWIEFLRDTGSAICIRVDVLLAHEIAICDAVRMEVCAGARDESHLQSLRRLLARAAIIPTLPTDYDDAAALYRRCRREGETVRKLIDCLISSKNGMVETVIAAVCWLACSGCPMKSSALRKISMKSS